MTASAVEKKAYEDRLERDPDDHEARWQLFLLYLREAEALLEHNGICTCIIPSWKQDDSELAEYDKAGYFPRDKVITIKDLMETAKSYGEGAVRLSDEYREPYREVFGKTC